jgi:peptidoglycan/LPS O-acetylase OafA/YrhL
MTGAGRVNELDAVRGIAAFLVVLHHCWQSILPDQNTFPFVASDMAVSQAARQAAFWINVSPFRLLFAGHPAVGIFFVLSGFVLTKSLRGPRRASYLPFVIRRVFRIWVPFALVILCAAGLRYLIAPEPIVDRAWLNDSWSTPLSWELIAGHLLMLGTPTYVNLDNPMWSLVHEMRISLVFPLLAMLTMRFPRAALGASIAAFAVLSINRLVGHFTAPTDSNIVGGVLMSVIQTVRYCMFFTFGIILALKSAAIGDWLGSRPRTQAALWFIALALLWIPYTAGYVEFAYAVGAFVLLALCIHSPRAGRALRHPALAWLGKVSYSLYLVHLLVLLSLVHLLNGVLPLYAILLIVIPLSLLAAALSNRFIELPCNDFGKRLVSRLPRGAQRGPAIASDTG